MMLTTFGLIATFAAFTISHAGQSFNKLTFGESPTYTIRLDETNTPTSLAMDLFGNGGGAARYVNFNYTLAKRSLSQHAVLDETGTLSNDSDTRITSMKSVVAVFTGGEATLKTGPTIDTLDDVEILTSGLALVFDSDPYFFSLTNTGASDLYLTSLEVTYSCVHVHSTISFETSGGSAIYPITQTIGSALSAPTDPTKTGYLFDDWYSDEELTTLYNFTVMPDADLTVYAKWAVDPEYPVLTIAEFKALDPEDDDLHFVSGTVILASKMMELTIIADATDLLIAFGGEDSAAGDNVRLGGYLGVEESLKVMNGDEVFGVSCDTYSHNNAITLTPNTISVADYNLLDPDTSTNWGVYTEIGGTIEVNYSDNTISLIDAEESMTISVFTEEDFYFLAGYSGLDVTVRGMVLPNMDDPLETVLMFVHNAHEDFIELNYDTPQDLLDALELMFLDWYQNQTYFPGQYVDLPTDHAVIPMTVGYELVEGFNEDKFDLETGRFDMDIVAQLTVRLKITITLTDPDPDVSDWFYADLDVNPAAIKTIEYVKAQEDSYEVSYAIKGVVMNKQYQDEQIFLLVADATGIIYVNTNNDEIVTGDEIVAVGYKITQDSIVFLMNDPSQTVDHIRAHNQEVPLAPIVITIADFNLLTPGFVETDLRYYELTGDLKYNNPEEPSTSGFYLTDGTNSRGIYTVDAAARNMLVVSVNKNVTICGLAIVTGEGEEQSVVFAYMAVSGITIPE
jgi:uncharacterized repeat protein (TIGR02543 family)